MTIHGRLVHRSLAIVATAVGIAAALLIGRATGSPDRAQSQVDNVIRPASEWVPLAIEYSIHDDMTGVKHYVVEYRAGDGSTRNEQVSDLDSRPMIRIDNLTTGKHYSSKEGQWLEHPLRTQRNEKLSNVVDRPRELIPVPS